MRKFQTDHAAILNYFVYLVGLHQVKNYYTFEGWYIKTNIEKKIRLVDVVQIF